jgi:V-type H+-transporting ATPase subunit E
LEGIILQGFLQLLELKAIILSREKDSEVVTKAAEAAQSRYKEISGRDIEFEVDNSLNDEG